MKRLLFFFAFVFSATATNAQWLDFSNNSGRIEAGFNVGQAGSHTRYEGIGMGVNMSFCGVYLDFIKYGPQHRYSSEVSDTDWNDSVALSINAGYQFPLLSWLRVMPLMGYSHTSEGLTKGSELRIDSSDSPSLYHPYKVDKSSRTHAVNFGGGVSIQPFKWFSLSFVYTKNAVYGGFSLNLSAF